MKRIKDLKASDFPGINSEKFDVWKQVEVSTHKKTNILWIISPIVIIILGIISLGIGAVFGFALSFFVAYLITRKSKRLRMELGITPEIMKHARLGFPTEPIKTTNETMKKCPRCAEWIKLEALVCRYCGHTFEPEEVKKEIKTKQQEVQTDQAEFYRHYTQHKINTKLSILKIILYIATGFGAFLTLSLFIVLITGAIPEDKVYQKISFVVSLVFTVLYCLSAWSIGKRKPWGRKVAIVTGFCSLIAFPLTILGIYILVVMFSKDVKKILGKEKISSLSG